MDLSAGTLFAALVVGCIGFGLFQYGRKQTRFPQLLVGLAMMIYPSFISGALAISGVAVGLLVVLMVVVRAGV